jgi:hypothetical protein
MMGVFVLQGNLRRKKWRRLDRQEAARRWVEKKLGEGYYMYNKSSFFFHKSSSVGGDGGGLTENVSVVCCCAVTHSLRMTKRVVVSFKFVR